MKISVFGLGKAGLPLAAVIANAGITVIGVDVDQERVDHVNAGNNPIAEEKGLADILKSKAGSLLTATTDAAHALAECSVHIVIVPLFVDDTHKPNFSAIDAAMQSIGAGLKKGDTVVLETTVPVGTTENHVVPILEKSSGMKAGDDFFVAYSPERIMTGVSISRFQEFPKIVGGINDKSTEAAFAVYKQFANPTKVRDAKTAELTKIAEGVYRDVNIAIANQLSTVAEQSGVNFWEMREAAKHEFSNILEPGAVGGHCIPVYPWFLINNFDVPLFSAARDVNDGVINAIVEKISKRQAKTVGVVGLAYRNGIKETQFSESKRLIERLKKEGFTVFGVDPLFSAEETSESFGVDALTDFNSVDVIVIMNKEASYKQDLSSIDAAKIIDLKNLMGD